MYNTLDTKKTNNLSLIRKGWLSPDFELTDGTAIYGSLHYTWLLRRRATITTSAGSFTVRFKSFFSRTMVIINSNDEQIGEATRGFFCFDTELTMIDGFKAAFLMESLGARTFVWEAPQYGRVMHIKVPLFLFTSQVTLDESMAPSGILPLLALLGQHFIILRKRRKAAQNR